MKFKRATLKNALISLMAVFTVGATCFFTACGGGNESSTGSDPAQENSSSSDSSAIVEPETVEEVAGVYTQYLSTDEIFDYLRSFQARTTSKEAQTVYELNTLVLTAGGGEMLRPTQEDRVPQVQDTTAAPITWDASQRRYELMKEFRMTDVGVHLIVWYYGTYTFDNRNVTLNYPEYASVNYFYGTGWNGCEDYVCYMYEPGDVIQNGSNVHSLDPFAAWYGSYIEPVRSDIAPTPSEQGNDSMAITLSMVNKTFSYDIEEANKAAKAATQVTATQATANNDIAGVYTQYLPTDEIFDYLRSFQARTTSKEAQTVYELNTLVLTAGGGEMLRPTQEDRVPQVQDTTAAPITWDASQRRYELMKEFRMTDVGVHLIVFYYGTYTYEDNQVTLHYPEYASVNYFYGTGWNGCEDYVCYMYEPGDVIKNGSNVHSLDPFAAWYGSYIEPVRSDIAPTASEAGNDNMLITVSATDNSFFYNVEAENKAAKNN